MHRGKYDTSAIRRKQRELPDSGKMLGMFPEGTRSHTGVPWTGKSGAARIALQAGVPVVPVVVFNVVGRICENSGASCIVRTHL